MDANLLEMAKRLKSVQRQEVVENAGMNGADQYSKDRLLVIRNMCRKIVSDFCTAVRDRAQTALNVIEEAGVDPAESNRGFLKTLYIYSDMEDGERVEAPSPAFMAKAMDHEQWFAKTKAARLKPMVYPFLEAPLEDFCALFDKEYKVYNTALVLDSQLYGLGVAAELDRTFRELMKEKNVLCIDDSNTILRDIIDGSDAPFVYEKLGVRYEHFLLDEFQDTANVQWKNFSPLLKESDSKGGQNLIVGDVKQSIYRWRGSDWKLLDETVPSEFAGHEEEVLDTNYRSLRNIVEFNNCFFRAAAEILDRMNGHVKDGPLSAIYADIRQKVGRKSRSKGSVSLTFCDKEAELQAVLEAVREAVGNGAGLSEIAVLVRSNVTGEEVAMHLIDNGIPVITDDSLKVKNSITVRRIVSLMSYADNTQDTVSGYLAASLGMERPEGCASLTDMAEAFFRKLKDLDEDRLWEGEARHIQSFLDHVQDYVASNGNNLRGFLKYWEEENPSISSPSSGDSVRVMTIHKSKGLDFPYVILPFAENINLYKAGKHWCVPDLAGTELEGIAEGVYDVTLSKSSDDTLFSEDYRKESFLQLVDNINTIYVAMTRASAGMHIISRTPSAQCRKAVDAGDLTRFTDFSQILYWFASASCSGDVPGNDGLLPPFTVIHAAGDDGLERFDVGEPLDFKSLDRRPAETVMVFGQEDDDLLPSFALNPESGDEGTGVCERGRLKFSADALDFFSDDGKSGVSASNRIKGVVLHEILSYVRLPEDLENAVGIVLRNGDLTAAEAEEALALLRQRITEVSESGWFRESADIILNEATLIDTDGEMYRPDRVVLEGRKVAIIDYKFGDHNPRYVRQLRKYSEIWKRMGYEHVSAHLWYVHTGEVMDVL